MARGTSLQRLQRVRRFGANRPKQVAAERIGDSCGGCGTSRAQRLRRRVQRIVVRRQDAALRCNMVYCVARHVECQAGGPRSASPPNIETAPVGARCTLRVACRMSVACCTVHSHRAQAAGPARKVPVGSECPRDSCVSASCDTCQDFPLATPVRTSMHVVPANPCLPVPSAMTAYPARSKRRHAHSSTGTRACARARACSRTDAIADAKQHVIASATSATRMKASRVGGLSGARSSSRCATWHGHAALARRVASLPFGRLMWRVRVLRVQFPQESRPVRLSCKRDQRTSGCLAEHTPQI